MTTLESRYMQRVEELRRGRRRSEEVSEEEVQYMLKTAPFIREYTSYVAEQPGQAVSLRPSLAKRHPRKHARMAGGNIDTFVTVVDTNRRNTVFLQYLATVEHDEEAMRYMVKRVPVSDEWTCAACQSKLELDARQALQVCPCCGVTRAYMEDSHRTVTYDQEVSQYSKNNYFAYKRLNHFAEWLNSLQAKENTEIPEEVLEAVRAEFKKERATKRGDITPEKVKAFLKKLKLNKYYEHKYSICAALNGVPAPKLPQYLEDRLKQMFGEIQEPFKKHCPPTRKNFLSYGYVLHKFCELLGEDELRKFFPLLKSSEKLYLQDTIWKNICKELGWEFIRSI